MKKFLLIISFIAVFVACDKEDHNQSAVTGTTGTAVSISEATIAPVGNETEDKRIAFTVTSDVPWKVQGKPSWLTVSPIEGKAGTTSVTMFAGINNQSEPSRSCTLRVEAVDKSFSESIEVFQERPYLEVSRENIDFTWDQCDVFKSNPETIAIRCNTDWEIAVVRSNPSLSETETPFDSDGTLVDWLMCSELKGSSDDEEHLLYFNPGTYNIEREPKSLELEIRGALDSYKLSFTQANLLFTVDIVDSDDDAHYEFAACNTNDVAVTVESELDWNVDSKPGWVVCSPTAGKDRVNVKFNVDGANPGADARIGELVLVSAAGTNPLPRRTIEIRQKGYMFGIQPGFVSIANNDLTNKEFNLVSSGSWAIEPSSVPEWLEVSAMSGTGSENGEQLVFAAKNRNLEFEDRSAKVGLHSTQVGNTMSQSVDVRQDKFIFDAGISESNIGAFQTSSHDLTIHSSGDWTIDVAYKDSADGNWLNFDKLQGEGDAVIKYNAKTGNPLDKDRSAIVSVKSVPHITAGISNVVKSFDITQSKYIFEVEPTPDMLALAYGAIDDKSVSILVNCSIDWAIECPDWLIPSQRNGSNRATVTFKAQNNLARASRSGKLVIKSTYLDKARDFTFDVTQSAFEFNSDAVEFTNIEPLGAGAYTVDVVCSDRWELRDCEPWVNASPTSGSGNAKITVRPQDNVYTESRQNTFCVYSTLNGLKKNITVSQKPFVFDTRSENVQEFTAINSGSARVVLGECMATWTVKDVPSWMTVSPSTGSGSATLTITPKENVNTSPRSATIKVVSDRNSSLVKEITVSQAAFVFDTQNVNVPEFAPLNPRAEQVVLGESMATWSVKNIPSWITVSPSTGSGSATLTITPEENVDMSPRSAIIKVVSDKNSSLVKEITVSQAAFVFDTQNVNVPEFSSVEPIAADVTLGESMSTWAVRDIPSWIAVSPTTGGGSATLTITPQENLNTSSRSATISVVSDKNPALVKKISVSQAAFVFDTAAVTVSVFDTLNPKSAEVQIDDCTSGWSVVDAPDWLTVEPASGTGAGRITLTPTNNLTSDLRSATFYVVSDKNSNLRKAITVSQTGYSFSADTEKLDIAAAGTTTYTVNVGCTGRWSAECADSWIHLVSSSATGNGSLTFTADDNTSDSVRTATIVISSLDGYEQVININISQAAAPQN